MIAKQKKRNIARDIAAIINGTLKGTPHTLPHKISEWTVKMHLQSVCDQLNLTERILSGDAAAVFELVATPAWEKLKARTSFRLVHRNEVRENVITNDRGEPIRPTDAIRLALWFIDKVGGTQNARKAFTVASKSMDLFGRK